MYKREMCAGNGLRRDWLGGPEFLGGVAKVKCTGENSEKICDAISSVDSALESDRHHLKDCHAHLISSDRRCSLI